MLSSTKGIPTPASSTPTLSSPLAVPHSLTVEECAALPAAERPGGKSSMGLEELDAECARATIRASRWMLTCGGKMLSAGDVNASKISSSSAVVAIGGGELDVGTAAWPR